MHFRAWVNKSLQDWPGYVPLIPTLRSYRRADLSHDLMAGVVVGMVTIPQAIAYALLAGVPAQSGLYACLLPMICYAVFGSSRQMVVGPVAVAALMVVATVSEYAPRYSDAYLGITTIVSLQAGLCLLLLRLTRMGGLVNLLSYPVITGFVNAAAILIILSQLPAAVGVSVVGGAGAVDVIATLWANPQDIDLLTAAFALGALALLWVIPRLLVRLGIPAEHALTRIGPMLLAILSVGIVTALDLESQLATIGHLPGGLPALVPPPFQWELWIDLLPSSLIIAVVAYIESYSIGATLAARDKTRVNTHQELIALGVANVGAAFTAAYPVAGSFSRSGVNYYAGARTQVASLACAAVIVLMLLFFTRWFAPLPQAVLAAIVMISVVGLMDLSSARKHWRIYRHDATTEYATLFAVLVFGVETGLITGVLLSIAFFVRSSSRPQITQVGRLGDTEQFRSIKRHNVETLAQVLALRVDENIYFANAAQIEDKCLKRAQRRPGTRHLVVVCSSVNMIDATGIQMLLRLNTNLLRAGIQLHLSDIKGNLLDAVHASNLAEEISGEIFFTTDRAMKQLGAL